MMLKHFLTNWTLAIFTLVIFTAGHPLSAQDDFDFSGGLIPQFAGSNFAAKTSEPATWSVSYELGESSTEGQLRIKVELAKGWHIYSTTQPAGGPLPTKISIASPESVKATASFKPDRQPTESLSTEFKGVTVEEYEKTVTWTAPLSLPADFGGPITIEVDALACTSDGSCLPIKETLEALPTENTSPTVNVKTFREPGYVVEWSATITPAVVPPGGTATLAITATPDEHYHVYPSAVDDTRLSTNFAITEKSGLKVGKPTTNAAVISTITVPSLPPVEFHPGKVTWSLPIEVPQTAAEGKHALSGLIAYQACDDKSCLMPQGLRLDAELLVSTSAGGGDSNSASVEIASAKSRDAMDAAAQTNWVDQVSVAGSTRQADPDSDASPSIAKPTVSQAFTPTPTAPVSFPIVLLMAFAGGVILNVMPCVLPVVGLKVMSFVKQAGEDRGRVLRLNYVYVLGIMSVFALLAALAVGISFSWGEQFTYFPVRLGLALLLFALALSYLGVWEIPVPGMASGKASQELQSREGYLGAFSKGVFTTILATPCSGPLLGYILGLTFALAPWQTVVVIMSVGVGMSLPYIVIGAKPQLVAWLPKPGPWMETLKQFLAFLFLGTVAFFFAGFRDDQRVPVFVTLIGVWFGCWLIGLVPNWESINKRLTAWVAGIAAAAGIGWAAFNMLGPGELKWEPYSEVRLAQLQSEGRTVMLDFTAGWCVNCKVNSRVAIDTAKTRELVEELNVVPMLADWTDQNEEIKAKLTELQSRSIPLLAIYPGATPGEPILLRDLVSQSDVLAALEKAGPSTGTSTGGTKGVTPVSRSITSESLEPALR